MVIVSAVSSADCFCVESGATISEADPVSDVSEKISLKDFNKESQF